MKALTRSAAEPTYAVLFAVGSGGNPERHLPILDALALEGCLVAAPYHDRIASPYPTDEELYNRLATLKAVWDELNQKNIPAFGMGHSIGASLLLALAGGEMQLFSGKKLSQTPAARFEKIVLAAPPTGYFDAAGALDNMKFSLQIWIGSEDKITPPEQMNVLKRRISPPVTLDLRIVPDAGHFSFMNTLPPHIIDTLENREDFLKRFALEVSRFFSGL